MEFCFRRNNVTRPNCSSRHSRLRGNPVKPTLHTSRTILGLSPKSTPSSKASPPPLFDGFLPRYRALHGAMRFVPHQRMYSVALSETFHQVILTLPDTLARIGCHSNIDSAVSAACKNIDTRLAQWIPALRTNLVILKKQPRFHDLWNLGWETPVSRELSSQRQTPPDLFGLSGRRRGSGA